MELTPVTLTLSRKTANIKLTYYFIEHGTMGAQSGSTVTLNMKLRVCTSLTLVLLLLLLLLMLSEPLQGIFSAATTWNETMTHELLFHAAASRLSLLHGSQLSLLHCLRLLQLMMLHGGHVSSKTSKLCVGIYHTRRTWSSAHDLPWHGLGIHSLLTHKLLLS